MMTGAVRSNFNCKMLHREVVRSRLPISRNGCVRDLINSTCTLRLFETGGKRVDLLCWRANRRSLVLHAPSLRKSLVKNRVHLIPNAQ